jgi:tetratricopeptide (TPR) repeat protein
MLDHPGIVPVYEVGEHHGQYYFSMKLVAGGSLVPLLDRYKDDPKAAARLAAEAAEAVSHAHARGVLHRDLKPANILVDPEGRPHVSDFGLAKRVEADVEFTQSGAILGTPAYMSPEQAHGRRGSITTATDVYGLGAVLYALLTGRPPFECESVVETVDAVRNAPPELPTRLNAVVPRDLETICLKCLEKDPRRRYPSAVALADDLHAWLDNRPIAACRVGPAERAWLWCRRKPAVAALSAAVSLAITGGAATVIAVQAKANAELHAANRRVEQRYQLAVEAIKAFHTGVSEDFLLKQDQFKELRDRLLKSAADFYGKLAGLLGNETDMDSRRALAASNFELADLTDKVGRKEDALAVHRAVLAAREALASEPGTGAAIKAEVGRSLTAIATLLRSTEQMDEALATFRRSESLLAGLAESEPSARAALAACRLELGFLLYLTGNSAEALAAYKMALAEQEAQAAAHDASNDVRHGLARTLVHIGLLLMNMGKLADSETELRAAMAIQQKLADGDPDVIKFHHSLAYSHYLVATVLMKTDRPSVAEYRAALAIQQKLADDNPAVTAFRKVLAMSHLDVATVLQFAGESSEAEAECRAAMAILQKLADDNPALGEFRLFLARSHSGLSILLSEVGNSAEAEAAMRTSVAILRKAVDDSPDVGVYRFDLALSQTGHGWLLLQTGRPSEAEPVYREALAILQKLADDDPKLPSYRRCAANTGNFLSIALRRLGRPAEASQQCERAITILEDLLREDPQSTEDRAILAEGYLSRGLTRRVLADPAGAAADARRVVALYDALPLRFGERWFLSACAHAALAGLAGRDGSGVSSAEATSEAETAVALLHKTVRVGYRNPDAYRTEDALDPLRDREDFKLLMMDLAFPTEPLAGAE